MLQDRRWYVLQDRHLHPAVPEAAPSAQGGLSASAPRYPRLYVQLSEPLPPFLDKDPAAHGDLEAVVQFDWTRQIFYGLLLSNRACRNEL